MSAIRFPQSKAIYIEPQHSGKTKEGQFPTSSSSLPPQHGRSLEDIYQQNNKVHLERGTVRPFSYGFPFFKEGKGSDVSRNGVGGTTGRNPSLAAPHPSYSTKIPPRTEEKGNNSYQQEERKRVLMKQWSAVEERLPLFALQVVRGLAECVKDETYKGPITLSGPPHDERLLVEEERLQLLRHPRSLPFDSADPSLSQAIVTLRHIDSVLSYFQGKMACAAQALEHSAAEEEDDLASLLLPTRLLIEKQPQRPSRHDPFYSSLYSLGGDDSFGVSSISHRSARHHQDHRRDTLLCFTTATPPEMADEVSLQCIAHHAALDYRGLLLLRVVAQEQLFRGMLELEKRTEFEGLRHSLSVGLCRVHHGDLTKEGEEQENEKNTLQEVHRKTLQTLEILQNKLEQAEEVQKTQQERIERLKRSLYERDAEQGRLVSQHSLTEANLLYLTERTNRYALEAEESQRRMELGQYSVQLYQRKIVYNAAVSHQQAMRWMTELEFATRENVIKEEALRRGDLVEMYKDYRREAQSAKWIHRLSFLHPVPPPDNLPPERTAPPSPPRSTPASLIMEPTGQRTLREIRKNSPTPRCWPRVDPSQDHSFHS